MADLRNLIVFLARQLADEPDVVEVECREGPTDLYLLSVATEDQGRMIGREGRTIQAMRTLIAAAARKSGRNATLELSEE